MRANRKPYWALTPEQKKRSNARSYLNTLVRRGAVLKPDQCSQCGSGGAQKGPPTP
jgi:hypothetical protein